MPRWPIRLKLMVGLTLVVGMMLILMGGSIFGLHSFHISNLTLGDQLREIGASTDLFASVFRLHAPRDGSTDEEEGPEAANPSRRSEALQVYLPPAEEEHDPGEPRRYGLDELGLALLMDDDLTAILNELDPATDRRSRCSPARRSTPDLLPKFEPALGNQAADRAALRNGQPAAEQAAPGLLVGPADVQGTVPDEPHHRLVVGRDGPGRCSAA